MRRPPSSTLFPSPPLFRSAPQAGVRLRASDSSSRSAEDNTAAWLGNIQQFEKIIFPKHGAIVSLVAAGFGAEGDQNVAAALHALDFSLQDTKLGRVDFIISGIHSK